MMRRSSPCANRADLTAARRLRLRQLDGDRQMLEWTTSLPGSRPGDVFILQDDAEREVAYGPPLSPVRQARPGRSIRPRIRGWTVKGACATTGRGCSGSG